MKTYAFLKMKISFDVLNTTPMERLVMISKSEDTDLSFKAHKHLTSNPITVQND